MNSVDKKTVQNSISKQNVQNSKWHPNVLVGTLESIVGGYTLLPPEYTNILIKV